MNAHLRWTRGHLLFVLLLLGALFVDATGVVVAEPLNGNTTDSVKTRVANDKSVCLSERGEFTSEVKPKIGMTPQRTETRCEQQNGSVDVCLHFESKWQCWSEAAAPDDDRNLATSPDESIGDTPFEPDPVVTPAASVDIGEVQLGTADLTPAPVTPEPTVVPVTIFQG